MWTKAAHDDRNFQRDSLIPITPHHMVPAPCQVTYLSPKDVKTTFLELVTNYHTDTLVKRTHIRNQFLETTAVLYANHELIDVQ